MVKSGRFTVELVAADTKVAFKEHTKDGRTYVEVEPQVEYFIRVEAEAGPEVEIDLAVDGKELGYTTLMESLEKKDSATCGLWSYDGRSTSSDRALISAKAKVITWSDYDQEAPFWTGKVEVHLWNCIETGETYIISASTTEWEKGDIGVVIGQHSDPAMKGVMTQEGKLEESCKEDNGERTRTTRGEHLETITLHCYSAVGLMVAGVLGPMDRMKMARRLNELKRGAAQVVADAANMPTPQRLHMVQVLNGKSFGPDKECDLFDLTTPDDEEESDYDDWLEQELD
jgi:hypothetical protein